MSAPDEAAPPLPEKTAISANPTDAPLPVSQAYPTQKVSPPDSEGESLKDKLLSFLRSFPLISSLLIVSLLNAAIAKDEFLTVKSPMKSYSVGLTHQFDLEKIYHDSAQNTSALEIFLSEKPEKFWDSDQCDVGNVVEKIKDFSKIVKQHRSQTQIDKSTQDAKQKEVASNWRWSKSAASFPDANQNDDNTVLKMEISSFKNRKTWAQTCSIFMIVAAVAEAIAAVLAIVSWIQPRLLKFLAIGLIVLSLLVLIFSATTIGLYNKNSDNDQAWAYNCSRFLTEIGQVITERNKRNSGSVSPYGPSASGPYGLGAGGPYGPRAGGPYGPSAGGPYGPSAGGPSAPGSGNPNNNGDDYAKIWDAYKSELEKPSKNFKPDFGAGSSIINLYCTIALCVVNMIAAAMLLLNELILVPRMK